VSLWLLAIGFAGYALWRLSEAAFGVTGEGTGVGPRPSLVALIGISRILLGAHFLSDVIWAQNYYPREYSWSILSVMSVPLTLLGLLERGPSHGYDLKRDYDAYFGRGKPLRYSQVYATLSRLARDGKAVAGPVEQEAGPERRRYVITDAGMADVERWLAEPVPPEPDLQSELFAKVVLALMLGRPADGYLDAQRAAHLQRMRELTELKRRGDILDVLLADHMIYRLEADLRWIDRTAVRVDLLARAVRR
jgi:DNA-binding PadR family transcriptional regulator